MSGAVLHQPAASQVYLLWLTQSGVANNLDAANQGVRNGHSL